ncbi:MAG: mechanosensitive ion channel [Candidatus Babeliales bacterium]|nr:mechanosensitive ion channel [Candidatus Babeliales bacterium]
MKNLVLSFILFLNVVTVNADWFSFLPFSEKKEKAADSQLIIASGVQEKQHQLNILKKEKELLESSDKEFFETLQSELNIINQKISDIKEKLQSSTFDSAFHNKMLSKLNEISQVLLDTQLLRKKIVEVIDQNIEMLETYLKDPYFKNIKVETKTSYEFNTLYKLSKDISKSEEELKCLNEEKIALESSLESNKKDLIALDKDIKLKEKDRKNGLKLNATDESLSVAQRGELLDLDIQLINTKKRFLELKFKELSNKLMLLNTRAFVADSILKILKSNLIVIENSLWISESDIDYYEDELINKKRESIEAQSNYSQNIKRLSQEKEQLSKEIETLSKKYKIHITDLNELNLWNIDPDTVNSEVGLYELGYIYDRIFALEREIELKETMRELEREKIEAEEFLIKILTSWHKITQHKFKSEEDINNEIKTYEDYKIDTSRAIASYRDKINIVTNLLNNQIRALNNLKERITILDQNESKFIKRYGKDNFKKAHSLLEKVEEQKNIQTDFNNRLIEAYSNLINYKKNSLKQINVIVDKLERAVGILQRSEYAISWSNIKNISPDIGLFLFDLKNVIVSSISTTGIKTIFSKLSAFAGNFNSLFMFLIIMLLILISYFLLRKFLLILYQDFLLVRPANKILYFLNSLVALIIGFTAFNLLSLYIWSIIFSLIRFKYITDLSFRVVFYLVSIPYLCSIVTKFAHFLIAFNIKNNFSLLNASFQKRFVNVFQFLLYSTIIIFFFREAFLLITYGKSELPILLLAFYSIILRSGLIFLIGKEEILSFIPTSGGTGTWNWIRTKIDKYYYLILIVIIGVIIISDPYIGGFSKLVSFILQGIIYTALLFVVLWWLQIFLKKISSAAFFKLDEEDVAHERFLYAKTFYSIFTIVAILFFICSVAFICAKIWGLPVSIDKVSDALNVTLFNVRGDLDQLIPITLRSFLTIFVFIMASFVVAWVFERFILRRIFDILLVDQGVQSIISSISYYLILIIIILVGFLHVGFGGMIPVVLGALAVGLAFAIKEPANDIIGYFIIAVERSIKIGDYIEVDPNTKGIVRSISARSIVIRRNNSVSIIVPNSKIISASFYNWNYVRGFVAFEDIVLTIPFNVDPEKVSKLLFQVLDENPNILKSPAPVVRLDDFSENGYVFMVRGFLSSQNVTNMWNIASGVRLGIVKKLRENNIEISEAIRKVIIAPESLAILNKGLQDK